MRAKILRMVLAAGLLLAAAPAVSQAAAPPPDQPATPAALAAGGPYDVTLITGDRVRLERLPDGTERATVVARANARAGHHTYTERGDVYVVPDAASALVASGRLDLELFNVSGLVRQGYDDASRDSVPLILSYEPGGAASALAAPAASRTVATLPSLRGLAVAVTKGRAATFWSDVTGAGDAADPRPPGSLAGDLSTVWLDARVEASLAESVPLIGGPAAWGRGLDGQGVTVAVLDSGIDAGHPDFAGRVADTHDFTGSGGVVDRAGHGTHVASIIAGSGDGSQGRYRGVAPSASLMIGKVLNDEGYGMSSWVIAGMEWAASQGADVVNLSLGGPVTRGDDPLSRALDLLSAEHGTLFVVAAGNKSPGEPGTSHVTAPGSADAALTVGATTTFDTVWSGSRRARMGDTAIKPELAAPGVNITAARADGTGWGDEPYTSMTGTSMAAPHVAGSAALLRQQHPGWTPDQIKAALTATAQPLEFASGYDAGAGRVDVDRATRQEVHVDRGVLDLGYFARPFDPSEMTTTRTLTYRNDSAEVVALDLAAVLTDEDGNPAPAGVLTIDPATLVIGAGEQADVAVTLDVTDAASMTHTGRITATGKGVALSTTVGFYKQGDTVDVTVRALDRRGEPATARVRVAPYQESDGRYFPDNVYLTPEQTEWTLRLPEGDYNVFAVITTFDESGRFVEEVSVVGDPRLEVRAPNVAVTLDARAANPMSLATPRESAPRSLTLTWWRGDPDNPLATSDSLTFSFTDGAPERVSIAPTQQVDDAPFVVSTAWDAGVPLLTADLVGAGPMRRLDAVQEAGPLIDGERRFQVVDAGTGSPDELASLDLAGRAALIEEVAGRTHDEQVQAAVAAGASGVVLYSASPGLFYPRVEGPVPVLALPRDQGRELRSLTREAAPVVIRLKGTPRTPYAYDVGFTERQRVSADLAYRVQPKDLAEVRTRIYTSGAGERGWRLHATTYGPCQCGTDPVADYVPATGYTRTEYVTADPDAQMFDAWQVQLGFPADLLFARTGRTYRPHEVVEDTWLKAPFSPGLANTEIAPGGRDMLTRRFGDVLSYDIAGMTDAAGHWTWQLSGTRVASRLYRDDELVHSSGFLLRGFAVVPAGEAVYRLEADVDHDGSVIGLSTRTRSAWTFRSGGSGGEQILPLLDVDYVDLVDSRTDLPALDLANTAAAGSPVTMRLHATHQRGSDAPPVSQLRAWVSFDDGKSWLPTRVRADGQETFLASYDHPALAATSGYVSLRVEASDEVGNSVVQTLERAYRLR